ncbi:hypothetical protein HHI36_016540 [Cryptolaemus montrouzieri]|uniref:Uncharacterized protein n=1 Tax=Cryptolaemus montrouzieri TaxID=559131 RepID=A0ABD2NKE7_9CUCU
MYSVFEISSRFRFKFCDSTMERRHLTREEMLRAVGMLQAGSSQREVSRVLGSSPSVINSLWSRFNETGSVEERHQVVSGLLQSPKTDFWFYKPEEIVLPQHLN